jgi:dTDP-glucose 4,6-dehydratase
MILITGGAGFIGANFVQSAVARGIQGIVVLDKLTYAANPASLSELQQSGKIELVVGDMADQALVQTLLVRHRPRCIAHFAAETHVDRSIVTPIPFMQTNALGTALFLESVLTYWKTLTPPEQSAFRFLHVSTDEVYGSLGDADAAFKEDSPYAPNSPYAASKAASDHWVRAFHHTYGLPTLTSNCSNNYGPYQFPEKLIPLMILSALAEKPLPIYGQGRNIRDWLCVSDHCDALWAILERGHVGQAYNIGGGEQAQMRNVDLVRLICRTLDQLRPRPNGDSYETLMTFVKDRPGHDHRYAVDASKLRQDTGWRPRVSFQEGLLQTIQWYLAHFGGEGA